jgi:hypothetical protein
VSEKTFGKYPLLPIGGLLLPIVLHGVHLLLPILMAGSASLNSSHSHTHHPNTDITMGSFTTAPLLEQAISMITIISALFTLWYLIRLWRKKDCSRRWAWIYTGLSLACFGLMAVL